MPPLIWLSGAVGKQLKAQPPYDAVFYAPLYCIRSIILRHKLTMSRGVRQREMSLTLMLIRGAVFVDEDATLPPRLPLPRFVLFSWIRMEEDAHRKQGALSVLRCDDAAARSARCAKLVFIFGIKNS